MVDKQSGQNEEGMIKPGFDARLGYYRILEKNMDLLTQAVVLENKLAWLRTLWSMYWLVRPYIGDKKGNEIGGMLRKINLQLTKKVMSRGKPVENPLILNLLHDATEKLYIYSKHMMLPIKDEEGEELDLEEFFKESDS